MRKQAAEIDTYARANIKDYKKLSSPVQSQIRRIIEDGRENFRSGGYELAEKQA